MGIRHFTHNLHRSLGRSRGFTRVALLLRNQCNCVIRQHLGGDAHADVNGEQWLVETVARNAKTFVDVGANVGNWTELFLSETSKHNTVAEGTLFEPSPFAMSKLTQKFSRLENIKLVEAAVSSASGEMSYFEEPNAGETSSLLNKHSNSQAEAKQVTVTTLDEAVGKNLENSIDFLKIDAEGYDLHVLRGASALLENHRVDVIQFEYNKPWALSGSTLADAYSLLEGFGYKVFILQAGGLYEFNYSRYGEFFSYSNFVAISPAQFPKMKSLVKGRM